MTTTLAHANRSTTRPSETQHLRAVLLVDDRPLVRAGLAAMLEPAGSEVVQVTTVDAALTAVRLRQFDAVIAAAGHLQGDGWCALAAAAPRTTLVALGAVPAGSCPRVRSLPETAGAQDFRRVIGVRSGPGCPTSSCPARPVARPELTPQESRILALITEGLTNREIADRLGVAEKTVKNYITGLFAKLQVRRRTHAAALVRRLPA